MGSGRISVSLSQPLSPLQAFQQAGCCEVQDGDNSRPTRILPREFYRQLRYWTQRAAIAAGAPPPTGLYDSGVWTRFHAVFERHVAAGFALPDEDG